MREAAVLPRPKGTSRPLPTSGSNASSGTASAGPAFATVALTRVSIHPPPCGEGRNAGSATAHHTRRPNASPNPPTTGFHALAGAAGTAVWSQPFQGKSRSLTVRGKIADARPSSAS
jgi:hypothetical protein